MIAGACCAGCGGGKKACVFERRWVGGRFGFVGEIDGLENARGDLGVANIRRMAAVGECGGVAIGDGVFVDFAPIEDCPAGVFFGAFSGAGEEDGGDLSSGEFVENLMNGGLREFGGEAVEGAGFNDYQIGFPGNSGVFEEE